MTRKFTNTEALAQMIPSNRERCQAAHEAVNELFLRVEELGLKDEDSKRLDIGAIRVSVMASETGWQANATARVSMNLFGFTKPKPAEQIPYTYPEEADEIKPSNKTY